MISVIGLLLCFIRENLTKKQRQLHSSRLVVTPRNVYPEEVSEKHRSGDLVLKFQQKAPHWGGWLEGLSIFLAVLSSSHQSLLPGCFQSTASTPLRMNGAKGKKIHQSSLTPPFSWTHWIPTAIVQMTMDALLGFYSFDFDLEHLVAGAKPGTANRGELDKHLCYLQLLPVFYPPSNPLHHLKILTTLLYNS